MHEPVLNDVVRQILSARKLKPIIYLITEDRELIHGLLARDDCFQLLKNGEPAAYKKGHTYDNLSIFKGHEGKIKVGGKDEQSMQYSVSFGAKKSTSMFPFLDGPQYHVVMDWQLLNSYDSMENYQRKTITGYIDSLTNADISLREDKNLILVSSNAPYDSIPKGYEQFVQVIDVPLIGMYEIGQMVVQQQNRTLGIKPELTLEKYLEKPDPYVEFLKGMNPAQIQAVLDNLCQNFGFCSFHGVPEKLWEELDTQARIQIFEQKKQAVSLDGSITFLDTNGIPKPGGMEGLEDWLKKCRRILKDPARAKKYGVSFPRGILLAGLPGSGKSLLAKYVANILEIPLVRFSLSAILNKNLGGSEEKLDQALKMMEASAPLVVWIDEVEKELPSSNDSGSGDSGVSRRCLARLLNWMQENKKQCFMCCTANKISSIPSELLRRGRLDRKYYTFLPMQAQCVEILVSHLKHSAKEAPGLFSRSIYDPGREDEEQFTAICNNAFERIADMEHKYFTGADLEGLVNDIKSMLFNSGDSLLPCDASFLEKLLVYAARKSKPYGETNFQETVEYWCDMQKNPFLNVAIPEQTRVPDNLDMVTGSEKDGIYHYIPFDFSDLRFDGKTWKWRKDLKCASTVKYDINMFNDLKDPILQQMNLRAGK